MVSATTAISRVVAAVQVAAFTVAMTSFVFWLVAVVQDEPHHWQDKWLATASPVLAVVSVARSRWQRYIDSRKLRSEFIDR